MSQALRLADEAATLALGAAAARSLPQAARPFVLALSGDLGAGKTTFVRGLLAALGVRGPVKSPTYGLLELYEAGGWQVLHLDLFRLLDPEELENLGVRDYHAGKCLWLVEWPEKGSGFLPAADVRMAFAAGTGGHTVDITPCSDDGRACVAHLMTDWGS